MKSYSSGEVAQMCDVTSRTVIRWITAGRLEAFKLPGRGNNRVSEDQLLQFLRKNKMPVPQILLPVDDAKALIIASDKHLVRHVKRIVRDSDFIPVVYESALEAGFEIANQKPELIIFDEELSGVSFEQLSKQLNAMSGYFPRVISFVNDVQQADVSFDLERLYLLSKPLDFNHFATIVEALTE